MRLLCSDESYYKLYVKKTVVYVFQHLPRRNKYITNCMLVVHTRAVDQYLTYSIQFVYISPQTSQNFLPKILNWFWMQWMRLKFVCTLLVSDFHAEILCRCRLHLITLSTLRLRCNFICPRLRTIHTNYSEFHSLLYTLVAINMSKLTYSFLFQVVKTKFSRNLS
jgi:hypothetical protein